MLTLKDANLTLWLSKSLSGISLSPRFSIRTFSVRRNASCRPPPRLIRSTFLTQCIAFSGSGGYQTIFWLKNDFLRR